jgi:hypothetical protein
MQRDGYGYDNTDPDVLRTLRGLGLSSEDPVRVAFLHPDNVDALHKMIRYRVYQLTGKVIDPQSTRELGIVMSHVLHNHTTELGAAPGVGIINAMQGSAMNAASPHHRLRELDNRVLDLVTKKIIGSIGMHETYMRDVKSPVPVPLPRSVSMSSAGSKALPFPMRGI